MDLEQNDRLIGPLEHGQCVRSGFLPAEELLDFRDAFAGDRSEPHVIRNRIASHNNNQTPSGRSINDRAGTRHSPAPLEKDLLRRRSFATRQEARTAVFDYIEAFNNPVRLHSTLDYLSPIEYEQMKERETEKAA